jgi:anti-anti-sigma factor
MTSESAAPELTTSNVSTRPVRPRVVEIAVRGDLDMRTGKLVQQALEHSYEDEGAELLSLDLSRVTFIDSMGLRVLLRARRAAQALERALVLASPSPSVMRLLEITGMHELFDVTDGPAPA